jgi:hypothetical protein
MKIVSCIASALFIVIVALYAADPPALKEGLWTIHTQTVDQPGDKKTEGTRSICRNHAYDDRVRALAKSQNCKTISENASGAAATSETECSAGGSVIRSKGTTTFTGDTATHSETHSSYTPAFNGVSETTMIMDQRYVGSCPAGMEPGDMMTSDGRVVHRRQ